MNRVLAAALATALAASLAAPAHAEADLDNGKAVFQRCALCHASVPGKSGIGPTLYGVVGRHSASVEGYSYSPAMQKADKTWDAATLDQYLTNPRAMVPGTKMIFAGLSDDTDRADVIAYLATLK